MRDPVNGRGVLDTNQASCLPEANLFTGVNQFRKRLTLPPLVLAEILLRANPEPTLRRLRGYDVRLGIDLRQAFDLFSRVSTKFRPFAPDDIDLSRFVTSALENPTDRHRNWARDQKAAIEFYLATMQQNIESGHRRARDAGERIPRYTTLDAALGDGTQFRDLVLHVFTDANRTHPLSEQDALFEQIMANSYLRRFWRALGYCVVSWSGQWRDTTLNFAPTPTRNDVTDVTLFLYLEEGDTLITNDRTPRRIMSEVEPSGSIGICLGHQF